MSDITMSQVKELADPKLRAIGEHVLKVFQLAAEKAAASHADPVAYPLPQDSSSAEHLFYAHLAQLPAEKRQTAATRALASIKASPAQRVAQYGELAKVDLRQASSVQNQVRSLSITPVQAVNIADLDVQSLIGRVLASRPIAQPHNGNGFTPQQALSKLRLRIHKLKCVDETDPEWPGDEEIVLGGIVVDALGEVTKVDAFQIGQDDEFSDGVEEVLSPPRQFAVFDLNKGGTDLTRYAAIWEKVAGPAQTTRHGMSHAQFQQVFNELGQQGYRLRRISGYEVGGHDMYAAVWEKSGGPAWQAYYALNRSQYQQKFTELVQQGYRLVYVNGYGVSGQDLYAGIWEKSVGPDWVAKHGLSRDQYQQAFTELSQQGFRLKHVSGYSVDVIGGASKELYAAIWEKASGPEYRARHAMTSDQFASAMKQMTSEGLHLVDLSVYSVGQTPLYAAIWERMVGPEWRWVCGYTAGDYQKAFADLSSKGFRLTSVCGYPVWPYFPRSYFATLVLAEKDNGGIADFLTQLWAGVRLQVIEYLSTMVGEAVLALIGTEFLPGIGTAIGAVVGWVLDQIVGWLVDAFADDVFLPFTIAVEIPSLNARWPGGKTDSPEGLIDYQAFGGEYQVTFDWQLTA